MGKVITGKAVMEPMSARKVLAAVPALVWDMEWPPCPACGGTMRSAGFSALYQAYGVHCTGCDSLTLVMDLEDYRSACEAAANGDLLAVYQPRQETWRDRPPLL
jgi:hypothetical protein